MLAPEHRKLLIVEQGLVDGQLPESGWSRRSTLQRGLFLGLCALLLAASPVVAALSLAEAAGFEASAFIGYKAAWGGLLGGAVSPIIAWWALADASRDELP